MKGIYTSYASDKWAEYTVWGRHQRGSYSRVCAEYLVRYDFVYAVNPRPRREAPVWSGRRRLFLFNNIMNGHTDPASKLLIFIILRWLNAQPRDLPDAETLQSSPARLFACPLACPLACPPDGLSARMSTDDGDWNNDSPVSRLSRSYSAE